MEEKKHRGLSLQEQVRLAKLKGKREIVLQNSPGDYFNFVNFENILANYTVIIAQPIAVRSGVKENGDGIYSQFKFKTIEVLSEPNPTKYAPEWQGHYPPEFLPLAEDEFMVAVSGGTTTIDGVLVTEDNEGFASFEPFKPYLLFLTFDQTRKLGGMSMGPRSALAILDNGTLEALGGRWNKLKEAADKQYGNSAERLKAGLKNLARSSNRPK